MVAGTENARSAVDGYFVEDVAAALKWGAGFGGVTVDIWAVGGYADGEGAVFTCSEEIVSRLEAER